METWDDVSDDLKEYLWDRTYSTISSDKENGLDSKKEILGRIFNNLSKPPKYTVVRINTLQCSIAEAKSSLQNYLEQEYPYGSGQSFNATGHPHIPDILLVSAVDVSSKPKECPNEVIVGCQCGTAVLRGAHVFAPGVIAAPIGMKRGDVVSVYSDVDGQCRKGLTKKFGGRKIFVGNGRAELARNEIFCVDTAPSGIAVSMTEPLYPLPSLNGYSSHCAFLQNLPSVVTSHALAPRPGETILDMCAAPGGKTTHIAQIMQDKGVIFALDKSKPKIDKIIRNIQNLNLTSIKPFLWDATKAICDVEGKKELDKPPFAAGTFDRILLDGPCSALGQRPQHSLIRKSRQELESFPIYQRKLLNTAVRLLKTGGTLVYSTCTIPSEENERQVAWALDKFPCLQLVKQDIHIGGFGLANCGLSEEQRRLVQRFDPLDIDKQCRPPTDCDTIGFFIAKFYKKETT
ncbi:putative methyltransferase NSUN6 [Dendronephthya gigantea]|uniref:putative methyltransferase NSUN6 n=1 Tax=Dendronephthya gigantea TaxID=151771 RepID=UPI00106C8868|nr:putative methyltransferase NSUN6 [Dendronephthya gigantea]